jgi:starch phosphorylase
VQELKQSGYRARDHYEGNPELRAALDSISSGEFSPTEPNLYGSLIHSLLHQDEYCLLADYQAYVECQDQVSQAYQDPEKWAKMSILNAARSGMFSSDRTIREYCDEIWNAKPCKVEIEGYTQDNAGLRPTRPTKA